MIALLAQSGYFWQRSPASWNFGELVIAIIIICGIIGVAYVALDYFGIKIPPWLLKIIGIVVVCFVAILAIRLLMSM